MNNRIQPNKRLVESDLSYTLIGILFKVHSKLGGGFLEKHYQRAVELELKNNNISYDKEVEVKLNYDGKLIGKYRIDFVIEDKIVLELKSEPFIRPESRKQLFAYLKTANKPLGIIANFGGVKLTYIRLINSKVAPR